MSVTGRQVALVAGGGGDIGRATALALAADGMDVAVLDRNRDGAAATAAKVRAGGRQAAWEAVDLTDEAAVMAAVEAVRQELGAVTHLVYTAGVFTFKPFLETSAAEWDREQAVNVRGAFHCAQAVLPDMLRRRQGCIVTVSSHWGKKGGAQRAAYVASKAALLGLTYSLAEEYKPDGIRVNAVCPGPVKTAMTLPLAGTTDISKWMEPEEVAATIRFVCSPAASSMTGASIDLMGFGQTMAR